MESAQCRRRASDADQSAWLFNMTAECEPVKAEPEWDEGGVSEAAMAEGLYAGHEIKDELVLGPELIQMQDIAFSMPSAVNTTEEDLCELKPVQVMTQFRNPSALNIYMGERPGPHICDVCSKKFPQKQRLIRHIRKLHRDVIDNRTDKHICDVCGKLFRYQSKLKVHIIQAHTKEKPFACDLCKKKFARKMHLTKHIRIHTEEKPFTCDVCKKQFRRKTHLTRHIRMHMGEKLFRCNMCKKKFAYKIALETHIRIHTGEKPFTCDVCKKQFADKSSLNRHRQIHTGKKPYPCSACNKQFTRKSSVTRHKIRKHKKKNLN